ncbi:MAG: acyltransferase family protein [Blautia sp.]|jgi:fucose 4-O-acetylase-like acetyltransferase
MKEKRSRIWLLSNMKAILIILVVFGHVLPRIPGLGEWKTNLRIFIWMFHMPAFLFVSGFLSKNLEKCRDKALQSRLLPYVMMTVVVAVSRTVLGGKEFHISLVVPVLTAWYFLVLFWYAVFTPEIVKIRWHFVLAVVLSLVIGMVESVGDAYAFSKAFAFYPFYLAGYHCSKEMLTRIHNLSKLWSIPAFLGALGIAYWIHGQDVDAVLMFSQKSAYHALGLTNLQGLLYRGIGFAGAILMLFVLIQISSVHRRNLTYIGDNTLVIYSFHLAFLYLIDWLGLTRDTGNMVLQMAQVVLVTVVTVLVLAVPMWNRGYSAFLNGIYRLFMKKEKAGSQ